MIDKTFAEHFARDWIAAWNAHDLERILSHYSEDFEMTSPFILKLTGETSGCLKGKTLVSAYWSDALHQFPELHFELLTTLIGMNSICLYYRGGRGLSAEVFHFDKHGKVSKAFAHYDSDE